MKKFNSILLIFLLAGIAFGQNLRGTDIKQISNITPGTVTASKALVVDANRNIATIRNLTAEGIVTTDTLKVGTLQYDMASSDSINGRMISPGTIASATLVLAKDLVTTSPLAGGTDNILPGTDSDVTLSIADAAADGSTKGAATFATNDFEATTGVVSIDYTNGQAASGSNKGFLTSADWTTFNGKQAGDATLTALAGLTIADVSIIEGTGADAVNMVASGGANYMLASDGTNAALTFITPATVLSNIGAQASDATLTDIADGTIAEDLVNTANPWADNEVADNITASSYVLLTAFDDSLNNAHTITSKWIFSKQGTGALVVNDSAFVDTLTTNVFKTGTIIANNIVQSAEVWIAPETQNPTLVTLPANAKVLSVECWVKTVFNSDGTDLVTVGYDGAATEYCTDIDVSSTGVKTVTLGATAKTVDATSRAVEVYYVNSGSEPETGAAHISITWIQASVAP